MIASAPALALLLAAGADSPIDARALFEKVRPSVVQIQARSTSGQLLGLGSGFAASEDGLIITNHHVVKGEAAYEVHFADGTKADVVAVPLDDKEHDVAVVRVDKRLEPLPLGDATKATVGDPVMLVGSPFGLDFTVSVGTVAAYRRDGLPEEMIKLSGSEDDPVARKPVLQLTAPAGQGNSGGPVLDAQGRVLAIVQSGIGSHGNYVFSVPSNTLALALETARTAPRVEPVYRTRWFNLGVSVVVLATVVALYRRGARRER
ncbi:MAG: trypsin-like peptidase domain-containing protein [Myxococcota bacterium]